MESSASHPRHASPAAGHPTGWLGRWLVWSGSRTLRSVQTGQRMFAFFLITLGVMVSTLRSSRAVTGPLIRHQLYRYGLRMLPMVSFTGVVLGFVIVGQIVFLLNRVGVRDLVGNVMVSAVVRELAPVMVGLLVLMRAGTASVIELGTSRALGEIESLEVMGIDPIHYLVVPRMVAMAVAMQVLTVYLVLITLGSGYLFIFLQDVPLRPSEYLGQVASALTFADFLLVGAKTWLFGISGAIVTSYHGLARPLQLEEVSGATVRAIAQGITLFLAIDLLLLLIYLVI